MRAYMEVLPLALGLCRRLPQRDVVDCAQGAFHDYWFAESRLDGIQAAGAAEDAEAALRRAGAAVRACVLVSGVPRVAAGPSRSTALSQLRSVCGGLAGLQLEGCFTGAAAVVASTDPARQLDGCATLAGALALAVRARDAPCTTCSASGSAAKVRLVGHCDRFGAERAACVGMDREVAQRGHERDVPGARLPARSRPQTVPPAAAARRRSAERSRPFS